METGSKGPGSKRNEPRSCGLRKQPSNLRGEEGGDTSLSSHFFSAPAPFNPRRFLVITLRLLAVSRLLLANARPPAGRLSYSDRSNEPPRQPVVSAGCELVEPTVCRVGRRLTHRNSSCQSVKKRGGRLLDGAGNERTGH